jgi:REP element-mobilizing transposase RayT
VPRPWWFSKGGAFGWTTHAQRPETPVRAPPPAFHQVQLLSEIAAISLGAREEPVCEDSGRSARPLRVRACGLRRHANHIHLLIGEPAQVTPSTVMQVLKQRVSRRLRCKPRKKSAFPTTPTPIPTRARLLAALPAAALLRFQRLESNEVRREAPLHAHESAENKIGRAPPRLALEQLLVLCEEGIGAGSHRSGTLTRALPAKSKAPFKTRRAGHPKFQINGGPLVHGYAVLVDSQGLVTQKEQAKRKTVRHFRARKKAKGPVPAGAGRGP